MSAMNKVFYQQALFQLISGFRVIMPLVFQLISAFRVQRVNDNDQLIKKPQSVLI